MGKQVKVDIQAIEVSTMNLEIEGMSNLLMNKFSDASKQGLLDKQAGKSTERKKRTKDQIEIEIQDKIHKTTDGKIGFPAAGFKKAMVEAATGKLLDGVNGKLVKGSFFVIGNIIPIKYKKMIINEAITRIGRNIPMVTYRPEFVEWSAILPIKYNSAQITPQQMVTLANLAGFHIGVGDWRPQRSGSYGMFKVKNNGGSR